jgi:hypothetical protein
MATKKPKLEEHQLTGIGVFMKLLAPEAARPMEGGGFYKPQYSMQFIISAKDAKWCNERGVVVKTVPESFRGKGVDEHIGKNMIRPYRNVKREDGTPISPLPVVDAQCNLITTLGTQDGEPILIGNGSKLRIAFVLVKAQGQKRHGVCLNSVQILDLKPYVITPDPDAVIKPNFTKVDGGFNAASMLADTDEDLEDTETDTVELETEDDEI